MGWGEHGTAAQGTVVFNTTLDRKRWAKLNQKVCNEKNLEINNYSFGEDFFAMVTIIQLLMVISADLCPRLSKCTFFYTSSNFGDITLPKNVHKV